MSEAGETPCNRARIPPALADYNPCSDQGAGPVSLVDMIELGEANLTHGPGLETGIGIQFP